MTKSEALKQVRILNPTKKQRYDKGFVANVDSYNPRAIKVISKQTENVKAKVEIDEEW